MKYVDGFVLVVQESEVEAYKKMATDAGKIWKKHGALEYFECMGDDLNPNMGGMTEVTFSDVMQKKDNETVWFSFIIFESKEHRDEVNAKVMKDPEMGPDNWKDKAMPFDMKRMLYGGFKAVVEEKQDA